MRLVAHHFIDLFAVGADWETVRIRIRQPLLAAQRPHRLSGYRGFKDLLLANIVRELIMIAVLDLLILEQLLKFAIENIGAAGRISGIRLRERYETSLGSSVRI